MSDEDEGTRIGLGVALGVVLLLVVGLLAALGMGLGDEDKPAAKAAAVADADAVLDLPLSGDIVGKLYFELGKADLPADAAAAVDAAIAAAGATAAKRLVLSGFHDASGDPGRNALLAKDRAKAVREALKAKGFDAARIALRKPEQTTGDGAPEEARRVEIRLVEMP